MADEEKLGRFISVTGSDRTTASFYLSAAHGDVESAVSAYFESDGVPIAVPPDAMVPPMGNDVLPESLNDPRSSVPSVPVAGPSSSAATAASTARSGDRNTGRRAVGGVATLATIADGRRTNEDDESGINYYAGGEKSGQMIQDPRGKLRSGGGGGRGGEDGRSNQGMVNELSEAILERARQRGPLTDSEREEFRERQSFIGAGYRLGDDSTAGQPAQPDVIGRRNVTRTLTFYQNGFTVDNGPLRGFDDPTNSSFLRDIERGFVPREMEEPGIGHVSINLVDMKDQDYVPPKPKVVPFAGTGNRLGSSSSAEIASGSSTAPPNTRTPTPVVTIDESRPIAVIQVRLSDGSRIIARLNEDHTVQNLRDFVAASRPGVPSFTLATTFPRRILTDNTQTIKDAQLSGAVVVQSTQ